MKATHQPQKSAKKAIKGIHSGKKRFRIPDLSSLAFSVILATITGTLALFSSRYGFDKTWYGDILTTIDCVIGLFALINIGYIFMEGICIENGVVFLGVDQEKQGIVFPISQLCEIRLTDADGEPIEADAHMRDVVICFVLQNGSEKHFAAKFLSRKKYRSILAYFENRS